jgi:hypothetical protein
VNHLVNQSGYIGKEQATGGLKSHGTHHQVRRKSIETFFIFFTVLLRLPPEKLIAPPTLSVYVNTTQSPNKPEILKFHHRGA